MPSSRLHPTGGVQLSTFYFLHLCLQAASIEYNTTLDAGANIAAFLRVNAFVLFVSICGSAPYLSLLPLQSAAAVALCCIACRCSRWAGLHKHCR